MFESRAQKLGLVGARSPKQMAARSKRSIASIRSRIEALSAPYEDIDEGVRIELDELMAAFDQFEQKLNETVQWLLDEAPY